MAAFGSDRVLAGAISAGGAGFFLVLVLVVVCVGVFWAMARSLRRMRQNVADGQFHGGQTRAERRARRSADPGPPREDAS